MKVECDSCGEEFERLPSRVKGKRHQFCSLDCRKEFDDWPNSKETYTCTYCGKEFKRESYHTKGRKNLFCSQECHKGFQREKRQEYWTTFVCDTCGKEFERRKSRRNGHFHFCCNECRFRFQRTHSDQYAKEGSRFAGAKSFEEHKKENSKARLRTKFWKNLSKERRDFDSHTCQICGASPASQVHHLIPWYRTQTDSWPNLITLCRSCHQKLERVTEICEPDSTEEAKYLLLAVHMERTFKHLDGEAEKIKEAIKRK